MSEAFLTLSRWGLGTLSQLKREYTMDQVEHLYKVAVRLNKLDVLNSSVASRVAFGADAQHWKQFVGDMTEQPEEEVKLATKEEIETLKKWIKRK